MDKNADYIQTVSQWYEAVSDNGLNYFLVFRGPDDGLRHRPVEVNEDFYEVLSEMQARDQYDVLESYTTRIELEPQLASSRNWQLPPKNKIEEKLPPAVISLAKLIARVHGAYEEAMKSLRAQLPEIQGMKLPELRRLLARLQDAGVPECGLLQEIKLRIIELTDPDD